MGIKPTSQHVPQSSGLRCSGSFVDARWTFMMAVIFIVTGHTV
jgi:hypothetical protein